MARECGIGSSGFGVFRGNPVGAASGCEIETNGAPVGAASSCDMRARAKATVCGLLILSGFLLSPPLLHSHTFYVSITSVKYDESRRELSLAVKMFTNDFEAAIKHMSAAEIRLEAGGEVAEMNRLVDKYVQSNVQIYLDSNRVQTQFVALRNEEETTWCHFVARDVGEFRNMIVENRLLIELFESQANIVRVYARGKREFINLDRQVTSASIDFDI